MVVIDSVSMTVEMVLHGIGMYAIGVIMVVGCVVSGCGNSACWCGDSIWALAA